ncbi:MAG: VCBS repeat-containing protein, partial [Salinibacter sp.]
DGRLDLYVCHSGWQGTGKRRNRLYINQGPNEEGIPQFEEKAEAYGLDDPSRSTHATFFDYDRDGDLDLYLLNHATGRTRFDVSRAQRQKRGALAGDKLYRNDGGTFTDVSEQAGIIGSAAGYGLSVTVSDINRDGWPDLYVANDYLADDRLYVNQGDGTFEDRIRTWLDHTSYSSMGADIADVNNDGRPEIFTLDMLPEGQRRQKLLSGPKDLSFYRSMRARDYFFQYQRNMLHRNNGVPATDGRQAPTFSEVGQLAGVSNTDWSWAALFSDFNLDGRKDLYITNGYRRDYTNLDYLNSVLFSNLNFLKYRNAENPETVNVDLYSLAQKIPSTPIPNYAFRNTGNLHFEKTSEKWGLALEGFSTGAAYGDLNNDGAPDLVVNNIDQTATIYRNNARRQTKRNYLSVDLRGEGRNPYGIGAKVEVETPKGRTFYQEMFLSRGFQSSVEPVLHFGLGEADTVTVTVTWADQTQSRRTGVAANQTITMRQEAAQAADPAASSPAEAPLAKVGKDRGLTFAHRENAFVDFKQEPLLPHMLSRLGPALARGDVNGDGRTDLFVGGARGQSAALFVQQADGTFRKNTPSIFSAHRGYEDVDATFFDADGDGDQDLYVVSGGKAPRRASAFQDRLYRNDGQGGFTHAADALPPIEVSGGTVAAHDYNGDGRTDLFVGGRVWPGEYPLPPRSYLLKNTGGQFEDVTAEVGPLLYKPGMVTDALWHDLNDDGTTELILAGEWMPIRVFQFGDRGLFEEISGQLGFGDTSGWWYSLAAADLNGDGQAELVAGNRGVNAQVNARPDAPAAIYAADFADDGGVDPIMTHHLDGKEYPVYWHDTLVEAIPPFKIRFDSYEDYATSTIDDILTEEEKNEATRLTAQTFETSLFYRAENGAFQRRALPVETQFAPIHAIVAHDVNGDDRPDLLFAGNDFTVRPQWGRADAQEGTILLTQRDLTFKVLPSRRSGFFAPQDVRSMALIEDGPAAPMVVVGNNNAPLSAFSVSARSPRP